MFEVHFISIRFSLATVFHMADVIVPVKFAKICTYCKAEFDSQEKLEDHHYEFHDDGYYYSSQEDGWSSSEDRCSLSEEEDSVANVSDVFIDDDRDADFHPDDEVVKRKRKAKGDFNSKLKKKAKANVNSMLKSKIKKGKSVAAKSIVKEKQVCANFP